MHPLEKSVGPNPKGFDVDPIGYSSSAWHKWGLAQTMAGFDVDISKAPDAADLKSPVLWLAQSHALSEAAMHVLRGEPNLDHLPVYTKGICHCQYHAVALMLVGQSLETCLKAMLIIREGVDGFTRQERKRRHHRLRDLSFFIPDLTAKDLAILECLTEFVYWAGKYPDPGSGREGNAVALFDLSEKHEITAKQLFKLAARVMGYVRELVHDES